MRAVLRLSVRALYHKVPMAKIWFILRRMRHPRFALCLIFAATLLTAPSARPQNNNAGSQPAAAPIAAAFQKFWAAGSPAEAARAIDDIAKSGVTFDDALRLLKAGRTYTAQPTGVLMLQNRTEDDLEHFYAVNIPANYDPSKRYQVRFQLHGGIGGRQDNKPRGNGEIGALAGADQIYVLPYAWDHAPWWGDDQIQNLNAIIDSLKRTYNIDENRVVLSGVSDGATGTYFIAMRDTTPFASFLPLNGYIMVLANDEIDDGRIFPNNLRNKPLFVVNGGKDRLYPIVNGRTVYAAPDERWRRYHLRSAARRRAQHKMVAGGQGHVREIRDRPSARPESRQAHLAGRGSHLQPGPLADHRQVRSRAGRGQNDGRRKRRH